MNLFNFNDFESYFKFLNKSMNNLSELEKVRLIYLTLLSNNFTFSTDYYFGNSKTQAEIIRKTKRSEQGLIEIMKNKNITCKSMAYLFQYVCNYYDIDVTTIKEDIGSGVVPHYYNFVKLSNGLLFSADPQKDLSSVQFGLKTNYFGLDYDNYYKVINKDEIEQLDKKLNYEFINPIDSNAATELSRAVTVNEKIEILLSSVDKDLFLQRGYIERRNYLSKLLKQNLKSNETAKVNFTDLISKIELEKKDYRLVISVNSQKGVAYYFDEQTVDFIEKPYEGLIDSINIKYNTLKKLPSYINKS